MNYEISGIFIDLMKNSSGYLDPMCQLSFTYRFPWLSFHRNYGSTFIARAIVPRYQVSCCVYRVRFAADMASLLESSCGETGYREFLWRNWISPGGWLHLLGFHSVLLDIVTVGILITLLTVIQVLKEWSFSSLVQFRIASNTLVYGSEGWWIVVLGRFILLGLLFYMVLGAPLSHIAS